MHRESSRFHRESSRATNAYLRYSIAKPTARVMVEDLPQRMASVNADGGCSAITFDLLCPVGIRRVE